MVGVIRIAVGMLRAQDRAASRLARAPDVLEASGLFI